MLEELENRARLCLQEVTRGFQYKILLHHEAPELQTKARNEYWSTSALEFCSGNVLQLMKLMTSFHKSVLRSLI